MASALNNHKPVCRDHNYDGGYLPVNAEKIEERLHQVWLETNADSSLPGPVLKLCLANIVVITDNLQRDKAERFSQKLAQLHPSRIILITIDNSPNLYQAYIATSCTLDKETRFLTCWEIIEIAAGKRFSEDIPGAIRSLLVGSVPVVTIDFRLNYDTPQLNDAIGKLSDYHFYAAENYSTNITGKNRMPLTWFKMLPLRRIFSDISGRLICINKKLEMKSLIVSFNSDNESYLRLFAGWIIYRLNGSIVGGSLKDNLKVEIASRQLSFECRYLEEDEITIVTVKLTDGTEINISHSKNEDTEMEYYKASHPLITFERVEEINSLEEYILECTRNSCEFEEYLESKLMVENM